MLQRSAKNVRVFDEGVNWIIISTSQSRGTIHCEQAARQGRFGIWTTGGLEQERTQIEIGKCEKHEIIAGEFDRSKPVGKDWKQRETSVETPGIGYRRTVQSVGIQELPYAVHCMLH